MSKYYIVISLIVISLSFSKCNQNPTLPKGATSGKVVTITDGDTFKLLLKDSTLIRVRIANIDCPERKQPFSKKAKKFTSDAIFNKEVYLNIDSKDRYGRTIAEVFYDDNKNLGRELVLNGFAWNFIKYSKDKYLDTLQLQAIKNKSGLWKDPNAIAPWDWRKTKRKKKAN